MITKFFVYKFGNAYIKVGKNFRLYLTKNIDNASYWVSKKNANSWKKNVENKYPKVKLVECGICEK